MGIPLKPFITGVPEATLGLPKELTDFSKSGTANIFIAVGPGDTEETTLDITERFIDAVITRVIFNVDIDINDESNSFDLFFELKHRGVVFLSIHKNYIYPDEFHGEISETFDLVNPVFIKTNDIINYKFQVENSYPDENDRNWNSTVTLRGNQQK